MFSLADTVARATRHVLADPWQPALWTVLVRGRAVGALVREAGGTRLSWFAGADRRLVNYAGPLDGDVDALAEALTARLGAPVELASLPG